MRFLSYRDLRVSGKFIYIAYAIVFFVGLLNLCAMRTLRWENQVSVYTVDELGESYRRLYELAYGAAREAYAPYSRFRPGFARSVLPCSMRGRGSRMCLSPCWRSLR